jgi:hypothetical protein
MGRRVLEPQLTDNACRQRYASHLCLRAPSRSHSVVTPPPLGGCTRHGLTVAPALWVVAFITVKAPLCVVVKSRAEQRGRERNELGLRGRESVKSFVSLISSGSYWMKIYGHHASGRNQPIWSSKKAAQACVLADAHHAPWAGPIL